jgi:peptidylprolyl isomerase
MRFLLVGALALSLTLAGVGCGGDDDGGEPSATASDSGAPDDEAATTASATEAAQSDGSGEAAQAGDTVQVHYRGTLDDGSEFDSSFGGEPLQFTLGAGDVIDGFDEAVTGMQVGETKTVTIPAAEAYGERDESQTQVVPRSELPEGYEPEVGGQLQASSGQVVTILEVNPDTVTLDLNHPLAGEDLTFELELVSIN